MNLGLWADAYLDGIQEQVLSYLNDIEGGEPQPWPAQPNRIDAYDRALNDAMTNSTKRSPNSQHVEQVLGNVPPTERCRCHEQQAKGDKPEVRPKRPSWLRDLLGK
jgi:hypothetical protein